MNYAYSPRANGGSDDPDTVIKTVENHCYFYAEVTPKNALKLREELQYLQRDLKNHRLAYTGVSATAPIYLHVHSPGGDLFAGFALADYIASMETPVVSVVDGYAASAATLITLAASRRYITPNSFILVHQLTGGMWGKYEELKDEQKMHDMAMERLIGFYAKRTGQKEKAIKEMLKRETWMHADDAVTRGFADEVKTV